MSSVTLEGGLTAFLVGVAILMTFAPQGRPAEDTQT